MATNSRNVALLAGAQAVFMTTVNINVIVTSLVGVMIAPEPWLATLPLSVMFIASMVTTLPASMLMGVFGRKSVFIGAVLVGIVACLAQGFATIWGHFPMYLLASALLGITNGTAQFYRYAATDNAAESEKARCLSLVLAGGIAAAIVGPTLSRMTFTIIPDHIYAGCFFAAAAVQMSALFFLPFLRITRVATPEKSAFSVGWLFRQPYFIAGLTAAALGYGIMTFIMTATPLQIVHGEHMGNDSNAIIIQWHVLAMLVPSLITGSLIVRYGVMPILWCGLGLYVAMMVVTLAGTSFWHYMITLIFLGLGWNLLFVGGSSIIAQACPPEGRAKTQGIADMMIVGMVALASLMAAWFHYLYGWQVMMGVALVLVGVIAVSLIVAMIYQPASSRPTNRPPNHQ